MWTISIPPRMTRALLKDLNPSMDRIRRGIVTLTRT
jgi:hypothetical protein